MSRASELANVIQLLAGTLGCTANEVIRALTGLLSEEEAVEIERMLKTWEA